MNWRLFLIGALNGVLMIVLDFRANNWQFWLILFYILIYSNCLQKWADRSKKKDNNK